MTPERWRVASDLFEQALEVPDAMRQAWLDERCAADPELESEVASLLASHLQVQSGFLEAQVKGAVVALFEGSSAADAERRIGPYRLIRELGRGGMGTVYLAERDDEHYQSSVAIKLIRPGFDTDFILARFKRERQILAHMKHPNIPRLLDGGTSEDGMPYIVMEYIEGSWITDYAKLYDLGIEQRLRLFIDVCSAVEHAHRNFVVHRDLKPGNILVDSNGVPKLLDFGICKLLHADPMAGSETMAAMLTPDYASPEQIRGDPVTIASDVYSLGAVLYELLTGTRPHRIERFTPMEIERAICIDDTAQPSSVARSPAIARQLAGDLDNILLRALEKEPAARYPTAEAFAADLQRYLDHVPVTARPQTIRYRAVRFMQRHRGPLIGVAAVALSLIAGTVVSVRQARLAEARLQLVRGLANKFVFEVHDAVRPLPGSTKARELIVQTGLQYLDALAAGAQGDPDLEKELADAYTRIGDVQGNTNNSNLGNAKGALASYQKAKSLLDEAGKKRPSDRKIALGRARAAQKLGNIAEESRSMNEAIVYYEQSLQQSEPLLRNDPDGSIRRQASNVQLDAARAYRLLEQRQISRDHAAKGLALALEVAALAPNDLAIQQTVVSAHSAVGMAESGLGHLPESLAEFRLAVRTIEALTERDPNNANLRRGLMLARGHVADTLGGSQVLNLGDTKGAIAEYEKVVEIGKSIRDADPADQRATTDYGIALSRLAALIPDSERARKLAIQKQAIAVLSEGAAINPGNNIFALYLAVVYEEMGDLLKASRDLAGADKAWQMAGQYAGKFANHGLPSILITMISSNRKRGELAASLGRRDQALGHAEIALHAGGEPKAGSKMVWTHILPRRAGAMGFIYLALSKGPAAARDDVERASEWLHKSAGLWFEAKNQPGFAPRHQKALDEVQAALVDVSKSQGTTSAKAR